MGGFKTNALVIILFISIAKATETSLEDDDAVTELEEYTEHQKKEESLKNSINTDDKRDKKILSPYPSPPSPFDENVGQSKKDKGRNEKSIRKRRFLLWSYPQSPIVDMVMQQTISHNYMPHNGNDPFDFLRDTYPLPKGYTEPLEEYDYIIVGAGSAGSVLASRLTEDKPRAMVLLIEAGKPEMLLTEIPILAHYMQLTDMSWHYSTEKQPGVCLGSEEQKCWWRRGKAVGGTSVTNYMLYTRGRPQDWDRIAADGNYGWSYSDVLKYYIKSEKCELEKYRNRPYRGRDGELTVEQPSVRTGLVEAYLAAGRIDGIPTVDYNDPDELGFGYTQATTNRGHRMSAAKAFLHKHKRRRNLHILTETRATQVLIEPQTKRAYAVDYVRNKKKYRVRARREVILSAGPIASPQLLMLSGVGPQEHLQSLGIPVIQNLPVGKTLYDHLGFPGVIFRLNSTNASLMESKIATIQNVIQWLHYGDGLLSIPGGIEGTGYIKTSVSDDPEPVPDMEIMSFGSSVAVDSGNVFARSWGLSRASYDYTYSALNGEDTWSVVLMQLHPKSKGYLELRDTNPFSYPKMYGNYLTDPADMATFKESIQFAIRMGQSESFRKYGPQLHLGTFQSCPFAEPGSDEYWDCAVRTVAVSLQHQIATCKMGPPGDPDAVVDPELRVYGVDGLRVVDSSVIPRTIGAHTNAPAIMIGEKGADMIKMAWANVKSEN